MKWFFLIYNDIMVVFLFFSFVYVEFYFDFDLVVCFDDVVDVVVMIWFEVVLVKV